MLKPIPDLRQVGRAQKPGGSIAHVGEVAIGGRKVVTMAGPCSVETADQLLATALAVKNAGASGKKVKNFGLALAFSRE